MSPGCSRRKEPGSKVSPGLRPGLTLSKRERLQRNRQFQEIYVRGHRLSGPHLTIFFQPNKLNFNRLGLSVRKKRFKLSARRHLIQRYLREAFRLNKMCLLPGYDIIISAQRFDFDKDKTSFEELKKEFLFLAQKARLLKR